MDCSSSQFDYLFNPKSVAVIGASNSLGSWGYAMMSRLVVNPGRKVYPVNAKELEVTGIKAYSSILDVSDSVDFAVIAIPYAQIPQVMEECVQKEVKAALIISAGLAEAGEEGAKVEKEITSIARKGGLRFIGPNSMGHINTTSGFSTLALVRHVTRGSLGFISQSGTYGQRLLRYGQEAGLGFSKFISSGNEADLHLEDYLEYLGEDEETKVIIAFIEGLREGRRFFELARRITRNKPIVVLKVGGTRGAARAAKSHTAVLSGEDAIYEAMFKQCGVIRVDRDEEVFDVAIGLLYLPLPQGRRIGILTDGGGIGVVAAEACESLGLELATFSAKTMNALNDLLPPRWSHGNPVDIAIPKKRAVFDCLGAIMEDENVDAVILIGGLGAGVYIRELVGDEVATKGMIDKIREVMNEEEARGMEITSERMKELGKPLLVSYLIPKTAELDPPIYSQLPQQGIPVYPSPERAVKVLHHLSWYREYLNTREG